MGPDRVRRDLSQRRDLDSSEGQKGLEKPKTKPGQDCSRRVRPRLGTFTMTPLVPFRPKAPSE